MKYCAETLRLVLKYDPETGRLFWRERHHGMFSCERVANSWNARHSGKPAFTAKNAYGYHVGSVNGDILQAHRVAWAIASGKDAPDEIDHINGDRSDNRLSNLRPVSQIVTGKLSPFTDPTW